MGGAKEAQGWERIHRLAQALEGLTRAVGRLAGWLALALVAVILFDVMMRRWFVVGSTRLQELEWHLHGALFLLAMGYGYTRGAHVRIEVLHDRLSPRTQAAVELAGLLLLLLPFLGALIWFGWDYLVLSFSMDEASPSPTGLPHRWIIKGVMLFGFVLLGLAALARI
ncbi:MAG: TRAP transporter small permease subunit, partial [Alphaproteobacteria bacterium]